MEGSGLFRGARLLVYLAKMLQEKLGNPRHQDDPGRRIGNTMSAPGKRHHFDVFAIFNQLVDQIERAGEMHVVVFRAVSDQKLAFELVAQNPKFRWCSCGLGQIHEHGGKIPR